MPVKEKGRKRKIPESDLPGVVSNWIGPFSYADLDEALDGLECWIALEWRLCLINRGKIGTSLVKMANGSSKSTRLVNLLRNFGARMRDVQLASFKARVVWKRSVAIVYGE